jgi:hypothetical protein
MICHAADALIVVPTKMNPIGDGNNQLAALFDTVPAKRPGKIEDIAGAVLYLCSQAGVGMYGRLSKYELTCLGIREWHKHCHGWRAHIICEQSVIRSFMFML